MLLYIIDVGNNQTTIKLTSISWVQVSSTNTENMYLYGCLFIFLSITLVNGENKVTKPDFQAINVAKEIRGWKLNGSVIKEKEVDSENTCQVECVHERQCLSYNFGLLEDSKTFICNLSHSDRFSGERVSQKMRNFCIEA